jgi:hypothetical protein
MANDGAAGFGGAGGTATFFSQGGGRRAISREGRNGKGNEINGGAVLRWELKTRFGGFVPPSD